MFRLAQHTTWLLFASLLLCPHSVFASCLDLGRPLCQTFWGYGVIFDGTVINIEGIEFDRERFGKPEPFPYRLVTFEVHRAWKGVTGNRVQMLLEGGRRSDGMMVAVEDTFNAKLGVRYVIFGSIGQLGYVETSGCSAASRPYSSAVEALELLHSLDRPPTGGRILGRVSTRWEILRPGAEEPPRGITRVTLSGANVKRTVELTDGEFEFGGLPTGDFSLSIVRPSYALHPPSALASARQAATNDQRPRPTTNDQRPTTGDWRRLTTND